MRLKIIRTTEGSKALINRLGEKCYNETEMQQQISKKLTIERTCLLRQKKQVTSNGIPLILTYNCTHTGIKRAVNKHWDILEIGKDFEQVFTELPIIVFRRSRNLQDILGIKRMANNSYIKILIKMFFGSPVTPVKQSMLYTSAIYKHAQKYSQQPHTKLSKYTINSIAKANT